MSFWMAIWIIPPRFAEGKSYFSKVLLFIVMLCKETFLLNAAPVAGKMSISCWSCCTKPNKNILENWFILHSYFERAAAFQLCIKFIPQIRLDTDIRRIITSLSVWKVSESLDPHVLSRHLQDTMSQFKLLFCRKFFVTKNWTQIYLP